MVKKEEIISFLRRNVFELISLFILLVYLSPNLFFTEQARFLIHDNLNSNVVWYKNLAESGMLFSSSQELIPISLGGIPRGCYMSEFHLFVWIYKFFGVTNAVNIIIILIHIVAYVSARLLLRFYFVSYESKKYIPLFALCYAILPFWSGAELSLAGLPLLLYAFLNIINYTSRRLDWFIITLFPFVSYLDYSNLFFAICICIYVFYRIIKTKSINWYFFISISLFGLVSLIVEYRIFLMEFVYHLDSNRINVTNSNLNFNGVVGTSIMHTVFGHYHAYSGQFPVILITLLLAVFAGIRKERIRIISIVVVSLFISFIYRITNWEHYMELVNRFPIFGKLQLRFYVLFPLLWFIVFILACDILLRSRVRFINVIVVLMLSVQISFLMFGLNSSDYYNNRFDENCFRYTYFDTQNDSHSTIKDYYMKDFFSKLGYMQEKGKYAVCIGLEPEILQYNGIRTLDGYFYYYPKVNLRRMCEINRYSSSECEQVYGNRAFLRYDFNASDTSDLDHYYNFEALRKYAVNTIFSKTVLYSDKLTCFYASEFDHIYAYRIAGN